MHFGVGPKTTCTLGNATFCGNGKGPVIEQLFIEGMHSNSRYTFRYGHMRTTLSANIRTAVYRRAGVGTAAGFACVHLHTPLVCPRALAHRLFASLSGLFAGCWSQRRCPPGSSVIGRSSSKAFPPPSLPTGIAPACLRHRFFLRLSIIYCIPLLKTGCQQLCALPCNGGDAPLP